MANTSGRMLRLLSLLQTHRYWPGAELSERLEVSARTLRRDIDRLRDLGYQVDAVRGVAGGYQLRAGGSLPPLLLEDEEAVAIAVGLRTAAAGAVQGMEESSIQALTKVLSLMPPRLSRRMDALQSQTVPAPMRGPSVDAGILTTLAQGCRDDETVRFAYTARGAEETQRHVEPHRLVSLGRRWYLVAYDRDRQGWRSFRVDRVREAELSGVRYRPRELPAEDALAFVQEGIAARPMKYAVRVRFAAASEVVSRQVGWWGTVEAAEGGCVLTMNTESLDWPLAILAWVDAPYAIEGPAELVALAAATGRRLAASANEQSA
jgi:predicted DNA-binding transcriptional regulator YafY